MAAARTPEEVWESDLRRTTLREVIQKGLLGGKTLQQIKGQAKYLTETGRLDRAVNAVLSSEFIVNEKRALVARELVAELRALHPSIKNLAIIMLGSSVHGGSEFRDLTQNYYDSDFDWGMVCDDDDKLPRDVRESINSYVRNRAPALGKKAGFGNKFEACSYFNGERVHFRSFTSDADCLKFMQDTLRAVHLSFTETCETLTRCFYPSFPPDVNERNRAYVMSALKQLSALNRPGWQTLIAGIIREYKEAHSLKVKHIMENHTSVRTMKLADSVVWESSEVMSKPFETLLKSTGI